LTREYKAYGKINHIIAATPQGIDIKVLVLAIMLINCKEVARLNFRNKNYAENHMNVRRQGKMLKGQLTDI